MTAYLQFSAKKPHYNKLCQPQLKLLKNKKYLNVSNLAHWLRFFNGYFEENIERKMIVKNSAKKTAISRNAGILDGVFSQAMGLMFSRNKNNTLIFSFKDERIISLHMLFVFYPIDVLFLDKNRIVADKKENFRPFSFYKSKKMAMYAVEMPNGTIKKTKTGLGDKISFYS